VTKGTKAVLVTAVAVLAAVGAGWAVVELSGSGHATSTLGDDQFNAGYTEVLAHAIDKGDGQPLVFNDVSGGNRDIYVTHVGDHQNDGWYAFETRLPGHPECFAEWVSQTGRFRSSCDESVTFPPDGTGLKRYPTSVNAQQRLIIDLRSHPATTTSTSVGGAAATTAPTTAAP
jgi:hypothetical protein